MKSLGQKLKETRELIPFTLRQVEDATGISNAYLSQLENDKIKKPSASVLYKLAMLYKLSLEELLGAAGIIEDYKPPQNKLLDDLSKAAGKLTDDEQKELLKYLKYLRSKNDD
jgi:transcriptional regulator with XRE-family HTH domain